MIELPASPAPRDVSPRLIDFGIVLRPATGAAITRIERPGSRFSAEFSFPPMMPEVARVFVSRLLQAKAEGLRMPFPLLGVSQGLPGSPVVDGAGQSGTTLLVRGFTANYLVREGYWLSIEDADGQHYLHNAVAAVAADATGDASLTIWPPLRVPFADGDAVHLAKPMIEGLVTSEASWPLPVSKRVEVSFTLEEAA